MAQYILCLAALLHSCQARNGHQEVYRYSSQSAEFLPSDPIEVYYGEYLLASWVLSHSPWNAYHSGVGFLNNKTGEKVLVDYSPANTSTVSNLIFPEVKLKFDKFWTWLTGDVAMKWNNQAKVSAMHYPEAWPEQYTSFTYLGVINGSIFNRYMDWLEKDFEPSHVTFEPVEVVLPHKGGGGVPSRMCHDLVSESLWVLYKMGAIFNPKEDIFRDHIIWYAESFEEMNYEKDFKAKRDVLRYFRIFELHLKRVKEQFTYVREMLIVAWKMGISPIIYSNKVYVRVNIVEPFLNYCYLPLAIPPKRMDLFNDPKLCALPMHANVTNQSIAVGTPEGDVLAHLTAAEARLDKPVVFQVFLLTSTLVFVGSFRKSK